MCSVLMKSELVVCSSNAKANFPLKTTFNNTIQITAENEAVPGVGVETRESVPINFQKIKKKIATKSYAGEHNTLCGWIAFTNYIIRAHWINCRGSFVWWTSCLLEE
nr:hypothetical protein Iba_chr05cCG7040 [Ipomoea batatas]